MFTFKNMSKIYHPEKQYIKLVEHIFKYGDKEVGRNGNVLSSLGIAMRFDLQDNTIPILTSKKMAWKTCTKELLWFVKGNTNNKLLKEQNVKIWNDNGTREFLDSRNLNHLKEDDLGPVYGHQWRHYNAKYNREFGCMEDYRGKGIDQLQNIINDLNDEKTRYSRRHILTAWNPEQLNEMALPPCHVLSQYKVNQNDELSCILYQRSADVGLGLPFNILSYSLLTHLLAHHCNLKPKEFIHFIGDAHIYEEHIEVLKKQIDVLHLPLFPKLIIKNIYDDINNYKLEDFEIKNYKYLDKYNMKMRA